jgi:predicted ester cyclase
MASPEDTIKRLAGALNRHDPYAVIGYYALDATIYDPMYPQPLKGWEAIRKDAQDFIKAFPDLQFSISNVKVQGDTATLEAAITGTHRGPIPGPQGPIAPTGKRIEFKGSAKLKFDSQGAIVEERREMDVAEFARQLGIKL